MRLFFVILYVIVSLYFLIRGLYFAFGLMCLIAIGFILYLPVHKKNMIRVAKMKIIETQKAKQKGHKTTPFIEINSSPWYILAELPGVSIEAAKKAVQLRRENGPYPSMDVFYHVTEVKSVYIEHINAVAYVKNVIAPINPPENKEEKPENPQDKK